VADGCYARIGCYKGSITYSRALTGAYIVDLHTNIIHNIKYINIIMQAYVAFYTGEMFRHV